MRYIIEDTHGGFRLTLGETKDTRHIFDEPGGHGPLERLYVEAQQTADDLRARRRMGSSMSVTLTKDNIATAARYNDADSEELGGLEQWADRYDVSSHSGLTCAMRMTTIPPEDIPF